MSARPGGGGWTCTSGALCVGLAGLGSGLEYDAHTATLQHGDIQEKFCADLCGVGAADCFRLPDKCRVKLVKIAVRGHDRVAIETVHFCAENFAGDLLFLHWVFLLVLCLGLPSSAPSGHSRRTAPAGRFGLGFVSGDAEIIGVLLAIVAMACTLKFKCVPAVSSRLSEKFGKLWFAAEVILFVLVGAAVDIRYTLKAGLPALLMILAALVFRAAGVLFCTIKTNLTWKERIFCVIAYLPKATVQAAIGSVPLAAGLACGQIVLSVAVLAIIVTAPLGALGIDCTYKRLLTED